MRINIWRVVAFLLLIALSVGFGFAFDGAATAIEKHRYARPASLSAQISQNADEFGVPEPVLWATVKCGSEFVSNAVSENGAIGLMQLTPAQYAFICTELFDSEAQNADMLYAPEPNLRAGSAYLSYLFGRYGVWEHVFAAYRAGTDTVDAWLADPNRLTEQGVLYDIPDKAVANYVEDVKKSVAAYTKLYYGS